MHLSVIIAAAGRSRRFGGRDKLSEDLGGRTVLLRTVEAFSRRDEVTDIVVAGPHDDFDSFKQRYGDTLGFHGVTVVPGGKNHRWETVKAALDAVSDDTTHIAVHDAARPAVTGELLDRLFQAAENVSAVIPGVSVNDTIKKVSEEEANVAGSDDDDALAEAILGAAGRKAIQARRVESTLDRTNTVMVQTPQVFQADVLKKAYAGDDLGDVTDDAALVEQMGETVYVVEGDPRNIKITTPSDVELIRAVLQVKAPEERPTHKRF